MKSGENTLKEKGIYIYLIENNQIMRIGWFSPKLSYDILNFRCSMLV